MEIFSDMVEKSIEVFMDDFSKIGSMFDDCLHNLMLVMKRCMEANLVLNWEKCHFMVKEGIVLGHRVSGRGIEVDQAKIEIIEKMPPPTSVKEYGVSWATQVFIDGSSKISPKFQNLCLIFLCNGVPYEFNEPCMDAFELLKKKLSLAPIVVAPDWNLKFELMCNASDFAVGAFLGQRKEKVFYAVYYASQTLNDVQLNYATTEKELVAVVLTFDKFRPYLMGNKVIVFTYHFVIKYLMIKKDAKPRLIR